MIDGSSYQLAKEPEASTIISAFATGAPFDVMDAGPILVKVLNGNGIAGSAGKAAELLRPPDFEVLDVGDAASSDYQESVVIARSDKLALAQRIVDALGFGTATPGTVSPDVDAIVIVGRDAPTE